MECLDKSSVTVVVAEDEAKFNQVAANQIIALLRRKPDAVLGLATGSSPIGMYAILAERYRAKELDFSRVRTFNLDEYVGLSPEHPQSYRAFMEKHLFSQVNIRPENTHIPLGCAPNLEEEARRYEELLSRLGPVDLQVLGLGSNGHIGFNEPGTPFDSRTQVVTLADSTISANARFFKSRDEVPRQAISMGIASILSARSIMLLAKGEGKAEAIRAALEGEITPAVPASALRLHPDVLVVLDPAAARLLTRGH